MAAREPTMRVEELIGGPLPPSVSALGPDVVADLDTVVDEARRRQSAELRDSRDNALKALPWPLRKVVGKVLGG